ncbi:MAG: dockerin type I domain-containing protein [Clostridiales bacterium]|nr:dockerin type I domain-containing protein [Clostridiales bacterium]
MRSNSKTIKRLLSITVVLALLFTFPAGISAKTDDLDSTGSAPAFALPDSARADSSLEIKRVEVLNGGAVQATYRNALTHDFSRYTVYAGADKPAGITTGEGEEAGKYYTTSRVASMTDPRVFTMEAVVPADGYAGIGSGAGEFNPQQISWLYDGSQIGSGTWSHVALVDAVAKFDDAADPENIIVTANVRFNTSGSSSESWATYGGTDNRPYTPYHNLTNNSSALLQRTGDFVFSAVYNSETIGSTVIRSSTSDDFMKYEEIDAFAKSFISAYGEDGGTYGAKGRYVKMESLGKTTEGRDIWAYVVSDSKSSVDEYLNVTRPLMNSDPALLQSQLAGGSQKGVLFFNAIHGAETNGPANCPVLFDRLVNFDKLRFTKRADNDTERLFTTAPSNESFGGIRSLGGAPEELVLDVDAFLDKYIVVLTAHSNPDGYSRASRTSAYGYDMNRDAAYFSQPETRAVAKAFTKWDPIYMVEFHNWYPNYIIDGCTPPYEPNFEVDLVENYLVKLCDAIGMSIIGTSPHKRYIVPSRDVVYGWDNGSTIYTPPMSMLFGSMGSTIEFPNITQDSTDAGVQGIIGLFKYCLDERNGLMYNKLEFKRRGVANEDRKDLVDPCITEYHPLVFSAREQFNASFEANRNSYRIGAENAVTGRPRKSDADGNELPFFPEYYIIPVDMDNQRSSGAAFEMLDILSNCGGVKLERTLKEVIYGGVLYPAGTYVINMHQGARTFANTLLYDGYDASIYPNLYDSMVVSYPHLRGFDCTTVYDKGFFDGKTYSVSPLDVPEVNFNSADDYVVVKNSSADAVRLVNRLLKDGKEAYMINGYVPGAAQGDFVARRLDAIEKAAAADNKVFGMMPLYVEGFGCGDAPPANSKKVVKPVIGYAGGSSVLYYLDLYEFDDIGTVSASTTRNNANVYMLSNTSPSGALATAIGEGAPVVLVGSGNANNIITETANRITTGSRSGEALLRGTYLNSSLLLANMEMQGSIYTMNGSNRYISYLPGFMKPLAVVTTGDDYFVAGKVNPVGTAADYKGKPMIASGIYKKDGVNVPMTTIMNNVFSKAGSQLYYRIVANAMFAYASGILDLPKPTVTYSAEAENGQLDVALNYLAEDTAATAETVTAKKYKITSSKFEPEYDGSSSWNDYDGTLAVPGNSALPNYVHWYVENSADASNQGFFTLPQTAIKYVGASLSVDEESDIAKDVEYTLAIHKAEDVLGVELEFVIDGNMLSGKGIEALSGFAVVDGIAWRSLGGSVWKGTVTLGLPSGSNTGLTSETPVDIAKFMFAPRAAGDAAMVLTSFRAVGLEGGTTVYLESVILGGEAMTNIDQRVFSKYDLNRDNVVDALDLGIMLLYCGFDKDSAAWDTLVKVNDSRGKGVTASMCDVNGDGVIDMLDLLDLFIHYTR